MEKPQRFYLSIGSKRSKNTCYIYLKEQPVKLGWKDANATPKAKVIRSLRESTSLKYTFYLKRFQQSSSMQIAIVTIYKIYCLISQWFSLDLVSETPLLLNNIIFKKDCFVDKFLFLGQKLEFTEHKSYWF